MMSGDSLSRHRAFIAPSLSAPSFPRAASSRRSPIPPEVETPAASVGGGACPSPHLFSHNARISFALIPAAAFIVDLGGTPILLLLTVGLVVFCILDLLTFRRTALVVLSAYLIVTQFTFFSAASVPAHPRSLAVLSLALCTQTNLLLIIWATVNIHRLHISHPSVPPALERLLFACVPVTTPALFAWAVASALGITNAAYYHMAFVCIYYWLFALPCSASASATASATVSSRQYDKHILGAFEGCLHTLHLLFAPIMFFFGTHHATIFSTHPPICDILLLFFIPVLFLLYASTRGALGWLTKDVHRTQRIRVVGGGVALIVVVICLEIRVVLHSFGKYLHASPQVSVVLVTVSMLGGASAVGAYVVGMVRGVVSSTVFTGTIMLVSATGAVVLGFPKVLIPIPLTSGFYLAKFLTKRSLSSYFAFVTLASLMVLWFILQNFWGLNIWVVGTQLKFFCKLIFLSVVLAMIVPGLALFPTKLRFLTGLGLISHTMLLCYLENQFFTYTSIYYYGLTEEALYPSYMVLTTTCLGLAVVRRLDVDNHIGPIFVWILTCLYSSKIAMLFIIEKSVLWVSAGLLLAVSPPLLLYKDKSKGTQKMKPWQGYAHACVVAFSVWICRDMIFEGLQWWNGRMPSDGLLVGFCILLTGVACIPIVVLHFPEVQSAKKYLVLLVTTGLLFVLMQPPIFLSKTAQQYSSDISIYDFSSSEASWASWLLIATILVTLAAVTSIIPVKYIAELRALYAVGVGITFGIYVCAEFFFQAIVLYPLLVATITCAAVFVVFTRLPSASSTKILPWLFALMVALFPVTYMLEGQLSASTEGGEADMLADMLVVSQTRVSLLGLFAMLFMLIALVIKFELASLVREKVLNGGPVSTTKGVYRRTYTAPLFTIKRLAVESAWMPAVGNVSTMLCFIICLLLSMHLTGGSSRAIFFLAPILLLLNQDSDILAGFGDSQRYFPVTVAVSGYLILIASYRIWQQVWHGDVGWGMDNGGPEWFFGIKNAALLVLTLPNHILFNRYMWDNVMQMGTVVLMTMPLNLPSIIIMDVVAVRVLGVMGVVYSLAQYFMLRRVRIAGMKYI